MKKKRVFSHLPWTVPLPPQHLNLQSPPHTLILRPHSVIWCDVTSTSIILVALLICVWNLYWFLLHSYMIQSLIIRQCQYSIIVNIRVYGWQTPCKLTQVNNPPGFWQNSVDGNMLAKTHALRSFREAGEDILTSNSADFSCCCCCCCCCICILRISSSSCSYSSSSGSNSHRSSCSNTRGPSTHHTRHGSEAAQAVILQLLGPSVCRYWGTQKTQLDHIPH